MPEVGIISPKDTEPRIRQMYPEEDREPSVSIVIPAKNEARNLPHVFAKLPEDCEVILVDGYSTDDTVSVAQRLRPDITVIGQTRRGKGNALAWWLRHGKR